MEMHTVSMPALSPGIPIGVDKQATNNATTYVQSSSLVKKKILGYLKERQGIPLQAPCANG